LALLLAGKAFRKISFKIVVIFVNRFAINSLVFDHCISPGKNQT
jgi:hypothetical protein